MLSAARSVIFNAILAARIGQGSWNRLLAGDVANLDGRGSVFAVPVPDAELARRCELLELHPDRAAGGRRGITGQRRDPGTRGAQSPRNSRRRWP